jgi:PAS domain S-box-containing protein
MGMRELAEEGVFRAIVEQAAIGIGLATLDGRMVFANQYFCATSGYTLDELLAMSLHDLTYPDDLEGDEPLLASLVRGEIADYTREKRHIHKDGALRWVTTNVSLIRGADGKPEYLLVVMRDVSERVALEQAVAAHAAQLDAIFGAAADMVVVYDRDGMVLRANPALERALGLDSLPEYQTLSLAERAQRIELHDVSGRPLAPEEMPAQRIIRGEVLEGAAADDLLVTTVDGRELVLNWSGAPIFDGDGHAVGAVCIFRDVTERRALELRTREALTALLAMAEALVQPVDDEETALEAPDTTTQRLAELTRSVLDSRHVSIATFDAATGLLHARAAVGLSPDEEQAWRARVEGTRPEAHLSPDDLLQLAAGEVLLVDSLDPPRSDHPGVQLHHIQVDVPMLLGGTIVGALTVDFGEGHYLETEEMEVGLAIGRLGALVIDRAQLLREREMAQANALAWQQASQRMDEFMGLVSHELRTPLTIIKANLQLADRRLRRAATGDLGANANAKRVLNELRAALERTLVASERQERLILDLLDASRINEGKLELRLDRTDLAAVVREEASELRLTHPERVISVAVPDQPMYVTADRDRIVQVLSNYLSNALKYSADGQPIIITARVQGSEAYVEVRDHGLGIAPEELPRIWDRFYRPPGTQHVSGSGLGLGVGLFICRDIIERHGGRVGVESAVGKGTSFWFTLPLEPK